MTCQYNSDRLKSLLRIAICGTPHERRRAYQAITTDFAFPQIMRSGLELYCDEWSTDDLICLLKNAAIDQCEAVPCPTLDDPAPASTAKEG